MEREFGSRPEDILAVIGPSICQDCYEVSEDVAEAFRGSLSSSRVEETAAEKRKWKIPAEPVGSMQRKLSGSGNTGRQHCNAGNLYLLQSQLPVLPSGIQRKRGNLAAFLMLK